MKKTYPFLFIFIIFVLASFKFTGKTGLAKVTTNDDYDYIAINQILMWMSNNGDGSYDPFNAGSGFFWPKDSLNNLGYSSAAIFIDGIVWGGKIKSLPDSIQIQVGGSTYSHGLQAGKILSNGKADDPNNPRYRIYKIRKDWQELAPGPIRDRFQKDYDDWPVLDGSPWVDVDKDKFYTPGVDVPKFIGDEVVWFVSIDLDPARTRNLYGSNPMGIEQQTTVWGFNRVKDLGNMVFKKVTLINKGKNIIDSMFVSHWADAELGENHDNFIGTDTLLDMVYVYNNDDDDRVYPGVPPSLGNVLLQGPYVPSNPEDSAFFLNKWHSAYKNLKIFSSTLIINGAPVFRDPPLRTYEGSLQIYNNMLGRFTDGSLMINPVTGRITTYAVAGDPVTGTGWNETSYGGSRRKILSTGPFTFAPGDTQEVVFAYVIGRGTDRLDSISKIRRMARIAKQAYLKKFKTKRPPAPQINSVAEHQKVVLHWEKNAEDYESLIDNVDIIGLEDSTYNFEGYFVYQYRDTNGTDPRLIGVYDLKNDLINILDYRLNNGVVKEEQIVRLNNTGLKHSIVLTTDAYSGGNLYNASPYYFGVNAFAYNKNGEPRLVESKTDILEVFPGTKAIDKSYAGNLKDIVLADHIAGYADALVGYKTINPDQVLNSAYKVIFSNDGLGFEYSFLQNSDTLISSNKIEENDTTLVFNGIQFIVENTGLDSLLGQTSRVKSILEVSSPDVEQIANPIDLLAGLNSTQKWRVLINKKGLYGRVLDARNAMKWNNIVEPGLETYEIRFTEKGSGYYLTGYASGFSSTSPFKDEPKASDRVPFEIWTLGENPNSDEDDMQLIIKILDRNSVDDFATIQDSSWSHFPKDDSLHADEWEEIYAYYPPDSVYQEPLSDMSGKSNKPEALHKFGKFIIKGELPEEGTVIRIDTWKPLTENDVFSFSTTVVDTADYAGAKNKLDQISVFPNPYLGIDPFGRFPNQNFMRFINLPQKVIMRIYTISGQLVQKIEKENSTPWLDWDLKNLAGKVVASGIYIAHLEMPQIGKKIMKLAIVQDNR
jgi:hypothetical protein